MPVPLHLSRADILRARRACNKAIRLSAPLVGGAAEIYAVWKRLGLALKACPRRIVAIRDAGVAALLTEADDIYSKYIRLKYADENGHVACFTCNTITHWTAIQNGHFIKRQFKMLRFNDKNCHPQCVNCNKWLQGNDAVYEKKIIEKYGMNTLLWLKANKKNRKYARYELMALIKHYEEEVKKMEWKGRK